MLDSFIVQMGRRGDEAVPPQPQPQPQVQVANDVVPLQPVIEVVVDEPVANELVANEPVEEIQYEPQGQAQLEQIDGFGDGFDGDEVRQSSSPLSLASSMQYQEDIPIDVTPPPRRKRSESPEVIVLSTVLNKKCRTTHRTK